METAASAAAVDPANILVSVKRTVREFTPAGVLVQTIPFNYGGRDYPGNPPSDELRDIVVDQYGAIDSYNGTFFPFMSRYFPATGLFEHKTFPGLSTCGCLGSGGIAAYANFVFATDSVTNYAGESGIVRFDVIANTATRFADGMEFTDVNVGLDGKLYAIKNSAMDIYVYDPTTMQLLNHLTPSTADWPMSIAADQNGTIFIGGNKGVISRLSSTGVVEASINTGFSWIEDIDVDETGRVIAAESTGHVLTGDASLATAFASFLAADVAWGATEIHVSFARAVALAPAPIPTPTPTPSASPTPVATHNILVGLGAVIGGIDNSRHNSIREFTPEGSLLRQKRFNYNNSSYPVAESLRAIAVDSMGVVNAYNGTFAPILTRFSWPCSSFTHTPFADWRTENNVAYGAVATWRKFTFASDMGTPGGIVRFDTAANTAARFASGTQMTSLTMGLDGKLYAYGHLRSGYPYSIYIYNPATMQLLGQRSLPAGVYTDGKLAVDKAGQIFTMNGYGTIYRLSNAGALEVSRATGFSYPLDLAVDETNRIIMSTEDGWIVTGDATLASFKWFRAIDDGNDWKVSVAFSPMAPAPPLQLLKVVSQKQHGTASLFDLDLPLDGPRAVESRGGGPAGAYRMIFTFAQTLVNVGSVCTSNGSVATASIDPAYPDRFVVDLTGVANGDYVAVTLNDVNGVEGTHSDTVAQEMGVLRGDATGLSGAVNSDDLKFVRSRAGNRVNKRNFRADINEDGVINAVDARLTNSRIGTLLPAYP